MLAILGLWPTEVFAKFDPLRVPNNKYGIHIVDPNDIKDIQPLVNSSGGDWGYVTIVIQEDDRNKEKWQRVFDVMRRDHLIPIVRLATKIEGDSWKTPSSESIPDWTAFLNELNWPIENRYVILFNEPNHANEWGRTIDPAGYARLALAFTNALHKASEDYFVLPAGLDVSAASDGKSLDAAEYLKQMHKEAPELFESLDGWTSHSYPNPAFSGSVYATGRGTVRTYAWERGYLASLGVKKSYPMFITETGWVHSYGVTNNFGLLSPEEVGFALTQAAAFAWTDNQIVAITPFIFNYQGLPFDHFSWKKLGSDEYYPHYYSYQLIPKAKGQPPQRESYDLDHRLIPERLVTHSSVSLTTKITNTGQAIISADDGYVVSLTGPKGFTLVSDRLPTIEPNESGEIHVHLDLPDTKESYAYSVLLTHGGTSVTLETGNVILVPPPSVTVNLKLGWKRVSETDDATLLLYNTREELIHKIHGAEVKNGTLRISNLTNVIPNETYRVVVLVPKYLPRQIIGTIPADGSTFTIPRMYPLDFDTDGTFTAADVWTMLRSSPQSILRLIITP